MPAPLRKWRKIAARGYGRELWPMCERGTENLTRIVADADGIQHGGDRLQTARHFANTLFNVMRGGIFATAIRSPRSTCSSFMNRPTDRW